MNEYDLLTARELYVLYWREVRVGNRLDPRMAHAALRIGRVSNVGFFGTAARKAYCQHTSLPRGRDRAYKLGRIRETYVKHGWRLP